MFMYILLLLLIVYKMSKNNKNNKNNKQSTSKLNKSSKGQRIAIVDREKCKPNKCNKECIKYCPVESQGIECIKITSDIEDIKIKTVVNTGVSATGRKKKMFASIVESACIGCSICVKKCPFDAIKIVNIPNEVGNFVVHRYGENGFRLYRMPVMKPFQVLGLIGRNGQGKTTVMQILANKLKPNFEEFETATTMTDTEIISRFKGNELHKYMDRLYNKGLKVAIKPQQVDMLTKVLAIKGQDPDVKGYLKDQSDYPDDNERYKNVIDAVELAQIMQSKVRTLSGGELQRLVCASVLLKKADVYIFDEPTNFLDIKQRLNVARLITNLLDHDKYIAVIEHDLSILDYISDYISILYGKPGAFGVVSMPYATAEAINIYFDGYIPAENMRFRTEEYNLKELTEFNSDIELVTAKINYADTKIKFPGFQLRIQEGFVPANSSITVLLGQNGTGKTTFINYLATHFGTNVSHKPQYLNVEKFIKEDGSYPTVEEFLFNKIKTAYVDERFKSDVVKPMQIDVIKDRVLNELSGGELQRFWIVYCLGTPAHIYLIDEPSACLDVEQRVSVTKVLKRFVMHEQKIAFVIEHDMLIGVSLSQEINSHIIVIEKDNDAIEQDTRCFTANPPVPFKEGINKFLKMLDITFRTETIHAKHSRPRINKHGSAKDREQKLTGQYYQ